jgi:hypothetical protein
LIKPFYLLIWFFSFCFFICMWNLLKKQIISFYNC